jgi:hypothetical protein
VSDPLVLRESRSAAVGRLVLSAVFVGVSIWLLSRVIAGTVAPDRLGRARIASLIGILYFGSLIFHFAYAAFRPGTLTLSSAGVAIDQGWRKKDWDWAGVREVRQTRAAAGLVSVCKISPMRGRAVKLFGLNITSRDLNVAITAFQF